MGQDVETGAELDTDSWSISEPEKHEQIFRLALEAAEKDGDTVYVAELLTQVARAEGLQGRFDEAHSLLDTADTLIQPDAPRVRIKCLLERGRVLNSSGDPGAAVPLFRGAWDLALSSNEEYLAVDAAHMLGIAEDPSRQLEWNLLAIEKAEESPEPRTQKWLGPLYNNVGWTYHELGDYEMALNYFQKSLAFRKDRGQKKETRIASWTVGRALRSLGRYSEALAVQESNEQAAREAGDPDGYIREEIGECLLALGEPGQAAPHFARAFEVLSQDVWLSENEPDRLERLSVLGTASATTDC